MTNTNTTLDISGIIETFDADETRSLIQHQLGMLIDDSCEIMTDNFKLLYTRYASIKKNRFSYEPEVYDEAENRFFNICEIFIEEICNTFGLTMDESYLDNQHGDLPNQTLPLYLFFVLDLRSNLYNVLMKFISINKDVIVDHFDSLRNKHDAVTSMNRAMADQGTALIVSNIYSVVDWCLETMDTDIFFENMEPGYIAYGPVKKFFDDDVVTGEFVETLADIMKTNVSLKARICFDLICKLQGYSFDQ